MTHIPEYEVRQFEDTQGLHCQKCMFYDPRPKNSEYRNGFCLGKVTDMRTFQQSVVPLAPITFWDECSVSSYYQIAHKITGEPI